MKLRIKFSKEGPVKFIGHLDVMRYFQKLIRRAGIDVAYSEGFSPHQIMSFAAPLGLGLESLGEYVDIEVRSPWPSAVMVERMNRVSVEGIRILSVGELPEGSKNAMSIVAAADYDILFEKGCPEGLGEYLAQDEIMVWKKTKKNEATVNVKPLIYEYRLDNRQDNQSDNYLDNRTDNHLDQGRLFLKVAAGSADNLKPELVLEGFFQTKGESFHGSSCQIRRLEIYARDGEGNLASLESFGVMR